MRFLKYFLFCVLCLFNYSTALNFKADCELHKDNAIIKSTLFYSDDLKVMRNNYYDPITMTELIDFENNIKYKYCGNCEAGYINFVFPNLSPLESDELTIKGNQKIYTRYEDVEYLIYENDKLVEFSYDFGIYKLKNYQSDIEEHYFHFTDFSNNCPQPVCKRVVDIIFVLDESGSIAEQEWEKIINFCKTVVGYYEIGYDAAQVGIVGFGSFGVKYLDLSFSKTRIMETFNDILNKQMRGGTCTGCGLSIAKTMFDNTKNTERTKLYNPEHLVIILTDGGVADPTYYEPCVKTIEPSTFYNYCLGCCSSKERPYCIDKVSSCKVYNKTFKLSGSKSCSSRSECKNKKYNNNGFSCSGCGCDETCNYLICDECTIDNYYSYSRCRSTTSYIGCKSNGLTQTYINKNFTDSINNLKKDDRLISLSIGVGNYNYNQLKQMATELQGFQTVFNVDNYDDLENIINQLITTTCSKITDVNDCGPDCLGFCGCSKKCYCPTCEDYKVSCLTNKCTVDKNNLSSTGCIKKEVECENDYCHLITKNNNTPGCCAYTKINCNDNKYCTDDYCVSGVGCQNVINESKCEDFNGCTIDKCDNIKGCTNKYYDFCNPTNSCLIVDVPCLSVSSSSCIPATFKEKCSCSDPCEIPICNNGNCSCIKKNCDVLNSCLIGYCSNGKCLTKENTTKIKECQEANNDCQFGYCESSECKIKNISCSACQKIQLTTVLNCSKYDNKCSKYQCKDVNGVAVCSEYWKMKISNDLCLGEKCDPELGFISNPLNDYSENCNNYVCENGTYKAYSKCPVDSFCVSYYCENNTCKQKTNCDKYKDGNKCLILKECDEENNKCVYETKKCQTGLCFDSYCNPETGECENIDNSSNCDFGDLCVLYECNEIIGCLYKNVSCEDNDPCTLDYCDNGTCFNEPKCQSDNYCEIAECSVNGACIYKTRECKQPNDTCHYSICENNECVVKIKTNAFLDVCGSCVSDYGDQLNKSNGDVCIGALKKTEFAAVIGGAAIAGIIIACIVAAAVIGISSTLGVRELIKRSKLSENAAINENPLFEDNENEGSNPIYVGED